MTDPFSHEERMQAGQAVLSAFDALEDPDIQRHLLAARDALIEASDIMRGQHGFDDRLVGLALMGVVFAPILDRGGQ
jgi:hypothetical protein